MTRLTQVTRPSDLSAGDKVVIETMTGEPSHGVVEMFGTLRLAVFPMGRGRKPLKVWVTRDELDDPDTTWLKETRCRK